MARRTTANKPLGVVEPVSATLTLATAVAPLAASWLSNLLGKKKESFHFAPGTYERDYAAVLEAKKKQMQTQTQAQQIQQVQQLQATEQKKSNRALVYGAIGLGVLVVGAIVITSLTRKK